MKDNEIKEFAEAILVALSVLIFFSLAGLLLIAFAIL